jgi:hypothetical protein
LARDRAVLDVFDTKIEASAPLQQSLPKTSLEEGMNMNKHSRNLLLMGCCAIGGTALAQQTNPLVGEWRGVAHLIDANVAFDVTYFADNTFVQTLAYPPNPQMGGGSGIMYSRGRYWLTNDHTVTFEEQERKACPNADMSACVPTPAAGMAPISFRIEGGVKMINLSSGDIGYRVGAVPTGFPAASAPMRLPPVSGPAPMQACSVPGQTICPASGWLLTCNGSVWLTGSERCE